MIYCLEGARIGIQYESSFAGIFELEMALCYRSKCFGLPFIPKYSDFLLRCFLPSDVSLKESLEDIKTFPDLSSPSVII